MPVIVVDHVTKEYKLGQLHNLKLSARHGLARLCGKRLDKPKPFLALNDVSFSINEGEVVGIIGHNGAGKSTLLKLLSRITVPTRGQVTVCGKVAPLIEVGAGLVGEMTGRENVYLNGAILGITRAEIKRKFDEIVGFAELEEFIDTPFKYYSSGMQVRLGFAIATSVAADILIVDEVLAVGDLAFQRKCFDRMEGLIKAEGRTVLIVGHNIRQLERICSRVILMAQGRAVLDGTPVEVCNRYFESANDKIQSQHKAQTTFRSDIESSGEIEVQSIGLYGDDSSIETAVVAMREDMNVVVNFVCHRDIPNPEVVIGINTQDFVYLISVSSASLPSRPAFATGNNRLECCFPKIPLYPGQYSIRLAFLDAYRRMIWYGENIKHFSVVPGCVDMTKLPALGLIDVPVQWAFD